MTRPTQFEKMRANRLAAEKRAIVAAKREHALWVTRCMYPQRPRPKLEPGDCGVLVQTPPKTTKRSWFSVTVADRLY